MRVGVDDRRGGVKVHIRKPEWVLLSLPWEQLSADPKTRK